MSNFVQFPQQQLPMSKKTKQWRKSVMDWADGSAIYGQALKARRHDRINYDLLRGKLHMSDLELVLNPERQETTDLPDKIPHYPIMNSKLNVLKGEEYKRPFEWRAVVTNPYSMSIIEEHKRQEVLENLQKFVQDENLDEQQAQQYLDNLNDYYSYSWQDMMEIRPNEFLKHFAKEQNFRKIFNDGFVDGMTCAKEAYQISIIGGMPVLERLNPEKMKIYKSGYSNKIEDADLIVLEDYWQPGRVIDTYQDQLTDKDIAYLETQPVNYGNAYADNMDNIDERLGFINSVDIDNDSNVDADGFYFDPENLFGDSYSTNSLMPFDGNGNVRVVRCYWKSRRKIYKVKTYNQETGEEEFTFRTEKYIADATLGEETKSFWVNEAWEGTKIGNCIYVNIRPRVIQYNHLGNPSKCHFGIIGSVYNINDDVPYSMVDMMKPYNYLYDATHDKLNKLLEKNWGKLTRVDLAKIPKGWTFNKWMYYAKANGIAVEDSFREGDYGAGRGKLAAGLNANNNGVIDAELGNSIQLYLSILQYVKNEMGEVVGISRQREGQIASTETVGGVERSTLQSSNITEWFFAVHDDIKRRVLEAFLDTGKIAYKGRNLSFKYLLSDGSQRLMEIDGNDFADSDYGIVVDNSDGTLQLNQKIDMFAQAALQSGKMNLSAIMKLYSSVSISEKERLLERSEQQADQQAQQQQQQQLQAQQNIADQQAQLKQRELDLTDSIAQQNNETKILIAQMQAAASANKDDGSDVQGSELDNARLFEQMREFDESLKLNRDKLQLDRDKANMNDELKRKQIQSKK